MNKSPTMMCLTRRKKSGKEYIITVKSVHTMSVILRLSAVTERFDHISVQIHVKPVLFTACVEGGGLSCLTALSKLGTK